MEVSNCTFNTNKDYTLKYVANEGNIATFSNNIVNNSENFVELGSSVYPGSNYTANIINNTLGNGVNTHIIANNENQNVNLNGNVSVIAEGVVKDANGNYIASSNEGITNAISDGATTINLIQGNYVIPSSAQGKTLTIIGTGTPEDVKVAVTKVGSGGENCDYGLDGSTVTFESITITTNSSTYIGYARCNGTYKNCVINGHTHFMVTASLRDVLLMCLAMFTIFGLGEQKIWNLTDVHLTQMVKHSFFTKKELTLSI